LGQPDSAVQVCDPQLAFEQGKATGDEIASRLEAHQQILAWVKLPSGARDGADPVGVLDTKELGF